jgi:hypothetical protein
LYQSLDTNKDATADSLCQPVAHHGHAAVKCDRGEPEVGGVVGVTRLLRDGLPTPALDPTAIGFLEARAA